MGPWIVTHCMEDLACQQRIRQRMISVLEKPFWVRRST